MPYSTDLAALVAKQLQRLTTLNRHQLAGQAANLEFWLAEIRHALSAIDEYPVRFARLRDAQRAYVQKNATVDFQDGGDDYDVVRRAAPPQRMPDWELHQARTALVKAATIFLTRCKSDRLMTDERMTEVLAGFDAG